MEHKPHEGAAGVSRTSGRTSWKVKLSGGSGWKAQLEGKEAVWLGNRGLLERHHSFPYLSHISPEKSPLLPLPNAKGSWFLSDPWGNFRYKLCFTQLRVMHPGLVMPEGFQYKLIELSLTWQVLFPLLQL